MRSFPIHDLNRRQLAMLLDTDPVPTPWLRQDGVCALKHQLSAKLVPDLVDCRDGPHDLKERIARYGADVPTFEQALLDAHRDSTILEGIKRYSRNARHMAENPLCGPPATVLYYAAIASAVLGPGERISHLSDEQLCNGFRWAANEPGAERLVSLFEGAIQCLTGCDTTPKTCEAEQGND